MTYFLVAVVLYIFIVFFLARLVIPFMGFGMYAIPTQLPEPMLAKVRELESQSINAEDFVKKVYNFVQSRWHAERLKTIIMLPLAFRKDLSGIWARPGYAHCTTINYVLVSMLAASKFFEPKDLKVQQVFFNGVSHQYVKINLGNKILDVDPSLTYVRGVPFGQRTSKWFG